MSDATTPQPEASSSAQPAANAAGGSAPPEAAAGPSQTHTRREEELARKDRTLAEFMLMLDEYEPVIPAEVTDYYLQQVGFECHDVRLKRLISLAAQKFIADIASDSFQHARIRTNAAPSRLKATGFAGTSARNDRTRTVLTMDDLSAALGEYGINTKKPDFYL
ncbi:transcription initiation factor IID, TAF10 subunit [Calocera cornea HHB12733]|uniref:Transcription initiation factor TFIID subunit 10 n=1 Tax=Calocera cornea HHB12733 TaxID=1353952 RepID=A0A165HY55_9BASI|nr:transcription initiation factor IID, TAF10 subunit [Calocera cornea HHB12733]